MRAVLAGSPLHGTSLAAPDKLQHAMSLISNIGTFAEKTLELAGTANPFLWVGGKLIEVIVSVTGALAKTPLVDALVALVPGLAGQSAVNNNHEINRLRLGPCAVDPLYYAIQSNFETQNPGWKFWRNFRKDRIADLAADIVFPGKNDLVVDTGSMTDFGVPSSSSLPEGPATSAPPIRSGTATISARRRPSPTSPKNSLDAGTDSPFACCLNSARNFLRNGISAREAAPSSPEGATI